MLPVVKESSSLYNDKHRESCDYCMFQVMRQLILLCIANRKAELLMYSARLSYCATSTADPCIKCREAKSST